MTYARFLLYPGEVLRLDGRQPLAVRCERGRLWVTAGGEGIDHDLGPGQRALCLEGRILIEGDGVAAVETVPATERRAALPRQPFVNLALLTAPGGPIPTLTSIPETRNKDVRSVYR